MAVASAKESTSKRIAPRPGALRGLPLINLHLTDRCNSKCASCDYWRHGRTDVTAESVAVLLPQLQELGTHSVLLTGGEPLVHPEWSSIARLLRNAGMELWIVTAGLALAKHAASVSELFDHVVVSMDGADAETYARIRGVNAFAKVCEGVRAVSALGGEVTLRTTLQRANCHALPELVILAHEIGASQISFLAADVRNSTAFGRQAEFDDSIAPRLEDLPLFERAIAVLETQCSEDFASGYIAESPAKLRRLLAYFAASCGQGSFPEVRCNAPEFSAVIGADGAVQPCFFIPGPPAAKAALGLEAALNSAEMVTLREDIRLHRRPECRTCVCSMWREPTTVAVDSLARRRVRA
jgi:MoaA/NifB/PqqE/SkfB family radical SAM enzyme